MRIRRTDETIQPQDSTARASKVLAQITFAVVMAAGFYFLGVYLVAR